MQTLKPWYASKTIWGSLIAVAAAIASALGFDIDPDSQKDLANVALQIVTVAGSIFAVFGRLSATSQID